MQALELQDASSALAEARRAEARERENACRESVERKKECRLD
jgi:hypothetical protein